MKSDARPVVGIVAADPLLGMGLLTILEDQPDLKPLNVEPTLLELDEAYERQDLAAVLLDARSTENNLAEAIARFRRERPSVKVIAMGEPLDFDHQQAIIASGAKGYLAETARESEIRLAMEIVLDGSVWAPRKVLAKLIEQGGVNPVSGTPVSDTVEQKMTPRELDVLKLLMDGRSNRDIAAAMNIDEVTVKAHLGRMLRKTGASNRVELTLRALEERGGKGPTSDARK